jgi:hypothetical protein
MREQIPIDRAIILWDEERKDGRVRVTEVHVCDIAEQGQWAQRLKSSRGACDGDWMQGDMRSTPIGVFLMLAVAWGFSSDEIKIVALREFAKIAGQHVWAEFLLRELGALDEDA